MGLVQNMHELMVSLLVQIVAAAVNPAMLHVPCCLQSTLRSFKDSYLYLVYLVYCPLNMTALYNTGNWLVYHVLCCTAEPCSLKEGPA